MNPRQSRLGVPSVITLITALNRQFRLLHCLCKLGCKLVEMSLAASRPRPRYNHQCEIALLYYYSYLSSRYSKFQGKPYPHSRTKGHAKANVRHVYNLARSLLAVQNPLRHLDATNAVNSGVCVPSLHSQ